MARTEAALRVRGVVAAYVHARQKVVRAGFLSEIQWQQSLKLSSITESEFLGEFAWVVLAAGMKESVIRSKFPTIRESFQGFRSARAIASNEAMCRDEALVAFGHRGKIDAIIDAANRVASEGFGAIVSSLKLLGVDYLQSFQYMGPATSYHLAKNLGMDVVKPDRHLLRFAGVAGYATPTQLCQDIASYVGERVNVVDVVLWRFATLSASYLDEFASFLPVRLSSHQQAAA